MANTILFFDRPLAFTDLETTGTDQLRHEIIDLTVILVRQDTLEEIGSFSSRVKPLHPETATPQALAVNGYSPEAWADAPSLEEVMEKFASFAADAVLAAHNAVFEWKFLDAAFRRTGLIDTLDYHRLDLFSVAYDRLRGSGLTEFNLHKVAPFLGLPAEPLPHTAMNGARQALEVYRRLQARSR